MPEDALAVPYVQKAGVGQERLADNLRIALNTGQLRQHIKRVQADPGLFDGIFHEEPKGIWDTIKGWLPFHKKEKTLFEKVGDAVSGVFGWVKSGIHTIAQHIEIGGGIANYLSDMIDNANITGSKVVATMAGDLASKRLNPNPDKGKPSNSGNIKQA
ncbi:hypothetical protein H4219_003024 [Mycoemilia scoparia]|uniref:Uncharacterized protein n=1 Tax=Mycoemilia scoparia TaxID=417184 RepID=A0A9W7ZWS9_9FUNG|nr:hypothetical protein H4219_003024 [Mycoemilia scoparia]